MSRMAKAIVELPEPSFSAPSFSAPSSSEPSPLPEPDKTSPGETSAPEAQAGATPEANALVLRRTGTGASLSEQVAALFYRGAWKTPLHRWLIGGKSPPRLLAVPADPLPGDARNGRMLAKGVFGFRGLRVPVSAVFGEARPALPPEGIDAVHRFAWLRDIAASAGRAEAAAIAEPLVTSWLSAHGAKVRLPAWRADNCAWRLVHCAAHAPLILSSADLTYRAALLDMLARTARHLDGAAGRAAPGHDRLIAWAGVVAAGLLIPDGKARRVVGERGLEHAIDEAILPDGGAVSRSPLALGEAIAMLSALRNAYEARREPMPVAISEALNRAVPALLGLLHADGGSGAWQGAGSGSAEEVAALVEGSRVRARPVRQARGWGYQRASAQGSVLVVDAAPPAPSAHARTGCASTLAFEFSAGPERLVINCGGGALVGAAISPDLAKALRSTAAHSALVLENSNSTAVLAAGKLGRGVIEVEVDRRELENATRIELSHDGYSRAFGLNHRRILMLRGDGGELRGEDILVPAGKSKRRELTWRLHFHLGPDVTPELLADPRAAALRLASGGLWQLGVTDGAVGIEDSLWCDSRGTVRATKQLVVEGRVDPGGTSIGWALRKLG